MLSEETKSKMLDLASSLENGANADIYYDAADYEDIDALAIITKTKNAMLEAAEMFRELANPIFNLHEAVDEVNKKAKFKSGDEIIFNGDDSEFELTIVEVLEGKYKDSDGGYISFVDEGLWDFKSSPMQGLFGLKEAVDSLNESNKLSGPKIG